MPSPEWRNWQTRATQTRVRVTSCGFDSHLRHRACDYTSLCQFSQVWKYFVRGLVPEWGVAFCFASFQTPIPGMPADWRVEGLARSTPGGVICMPSQHRWTLFWVALVAVVAGTGLGLWYGWVVNPVEYKDTDVAHLYAVYRDDFVLMVGEAYAVDGDLDTARARLALLSLPDAANTVADIAEEAIERGGAELDVQALARLAAALGVQRDTLKPYLGAGTAGPGGQP
jgi:hypothetical protein